VPAAGLFGTLGRLERPSLAEGFDMLHHVRSENGDFVIEAWRDEF
jgi:hypothetical protein